MVTLAGSWCPKQTLMVSGNADSRKDHELGWGLAQAEGYEDSLGFAIRVTVAWPNFCVAGNSITNIRRSTCRTTIRDNGGRSMLLVEGHGNRVSEPMAAGREIACSAISGLDVLNGSTLD